MPLIKPILIGTFLVVIALFCGNISAKPVQFPEVFPISMTFRAFDEINLKSPLLKKRLEEQEHYQFIHGPGGGETDDKVNIIHSRWPNKIVTIQEAYGGINKKYFSDVWPGHLLYKTRTLLTQDISQLDETIHVKHTDRIAINDTFIKKSNTKFPFALTIYALDSAGNPDWSRSEHVILEGMKNDGSLIVNRGQWGTKALAFQAGNTAVAAHMMFWTQQWQLNFSVHSPRGGRDNLNAQEWYARQVQKRIDASKADGVEFDVGRWTWGTPAINAMDANNDGIADYGYLDGVNSFGLGGQLFFRELRRLLGPDKIIQADSNDAMFGVRGWKYINGVQLEAFPAANDFDNFSSAFLHLRFWSENAEALPRVSYPFTKTPTTVYANAHLAEGKNADFRFRTGFAAACLTGMPHPFASLNNDDFDPANSKSDDQKPKEQFGVFNWDEYHGGDLNDWHWLGKPLGAAKQDTSDLDDKDLLEKSRWQWVIDNGFIAKDNRSGNVFSVSVQKIPNSLLPKAMWSAVRLVPKGINNKLTPGREYTIEFEARGDDTWQYLGQTFAHVPRMITLHGAITSKADKPLSALVDTQWRTYKISFIASDSGQPTPVFGVSEQLGTTEIRNIKLHSGGAERWSREFEKGLVLLNMTNDPWQVSVKKGYYRHLKGLQDTAVNNGRLVDSQIIVPPRDAVFLTRR